MDKSKPFFKKNMNKQLLILTVISVISLSLLSQTVSASILSASTKNPPQATADLLTLNNTSGTHLWWVDNTGKMFVATNADFHSSNVLYDSSGLMIRNLASTFAYTLSGSAILANSTVKIPITGSTDTFSALGVNQTFTNSNYIDPNGRLYRDVKSFYAGAIHNFAGIDYKGSSSLAGNNANVFSIVGETNGATANTVGLWVAGNASKNNDPVFGGNLLVTNVAGTTGTKLVGLEIDVQPTAGTTISSSSGGLYLNAFNIGSVGPAIQTGGVSSGTFTNGILLNGIAASGSGIAAQSGLSTTTFLDTSQGTYSRAALQTGNNQKALFLDTVGTSGSQLFEDTSNNTKLQSGSGNNIFFVTNGANAVQIKSASTSNEDIIDMTSAATSKYSYYRAINSASGLNADFGVGGATPGEVFIRASSNIAAPNTAVSIVDNTGSTQLLKIYGDKTVQFYNGTTGAGTAALSTNSPCTICGSPYTWLHFKAPDGTLVFLPAWK